MKSNASPHCGHRSQGSRCWNEAQDDLSLCGDCIGDPTVPLYSAAKSLSPGASVNCPKLSSPSQKYCLSQNLPQEEPVQFSFFDFVMIQVLNLVGTHSDQGWYKDHVKDKTC